MLARISSSCEFAREVVNVGPCDGAGDCRLENLRQPAASSEPCESALDEPTARRDFEAFGGVGSIDDFELPLSHAFEGCVQLWASIAAVGENVPQPRIKESDRSEREGTGVAVLNIGGMHD
jgi:hypothetical protein